MPYYPEINSLNEGLDLILDAPSKRGASKTAWKLLVRYGKESSENRRYIQEATMGRKHADDYLKIETKE